MHVVVALARLVPIGLQKVVDEHRARVQLLIRVHHAREEAGVLFTVGRKRVISG